MADKSREYLAADRSNKRRRSLAPFAARVLAITLVGGNSRSTESITKLVSCSLGVPLSVRTARNYLNLETKSEAQLVPVDYVRRRDYARLRPVLRDTEARRGTVATLYLLDKLEREARKSEVHEQTLVTVLKEIEMIRVEERMSFNVQKPRRIAPVQPLAQGAVAMSLSLCDFDDTDLREELAIDIGRENEEEPGVLNQLELMRGPQDGFDFAAWWCQFQRGKSDSIPKSVQKILRRGKRGSLSLDYRLRGTPQTMSDFVELFSRGAEQRREAARPAEDSILCEYHAARSQSRISSKQFYMKNKAKMPEGIRSYRTFQRRYSDWKKLQSQE